MSSSSFIERMPKAELHVHIEGCLEPELVLELAKRNNLQHKLPYKTLAEAEAAFQYDDLQEFLDLRDATLQVVRLIVSLGARGAQVTSVDSWAVESVGFDDRAGLLRGHHAVFKPSWSSECRAYRNFLRPTSPHYEECWV